MSTFDQAYIAYRSEDTYTWNGKTSRYGWNGTLGNAALYLAVGQPGRFTPKPAAFLGGDLGYTAPSGWTLEGADMFGYENRTSSTFSRQTLLTSFPSGNNGMATNIYDPGRPRHQHQRLYLR